jgi:hypothetical protein
MVDKVKPLKYENSIDGTEVDNFPTQTDPSEDYLSAAGIAFANLDSYLAEKVGGILKFKIPDYSYKPAYTGDNLTALEIFNGNTQTTINRIVRADFTYVSDNITSESWKIYDNTDGTTVLRTITYSHTYISDNLTNTEVSET